MAKKALEGVKVADFTWVVAGPMTIKYLADHGAEVIHIESSTRPELLRVLPPFKDNKPGIDRSAYYSWFNNNKYGLDLNMNHPRAKDVILRLINWSDIIAENFTPGTMAKWGMTYEDLIKIKPNIIMFSTSQQGQTGPRAKIGAYGAQMVSLAGFTYLTGSPDRDPTGPYGPYTDSIVPTFGAAAIIAALINRTHTGKGVHIDLSQLETALNFISPALLDYAINHQVLSRQGNRSSCSAPHGVYRCSGEDRWCAIAIFNDEEWEKLCEIMGRPELSMDFRFATLLQRKRNEEELDCIISEWTAKLTAENVMKLMQDAGLAAGVAQTSKDLLGNDPQLNHRHFFRELKHKEIGTHHYVAPPFILSKTPYELATAAPCMGEHNEIVCKKMLGFSDEEYLSLVKDGVIC
jgi:benzylsuccinate CoA-transferase BbsF subunit